VFTALLWQLSKKWDEISQDHWILKTSTHALKATLQVKFANKEYTPFVDGFPFFGGFHFPGLRNLKNVRSACASKQHPLKCMTQPGIFPDWTTSGEDSFTNK
jgi:hypothetical protein